MPRTCGTKIGHVRVCGGSGEVTPRFYPASCVSEERFKTATLFHLENLNMDLSTI
jgi:hypothetical protein